jgi:serine/threonine protein kinase
MLRIKMDGAPSEFFQLQDGLIGEGSFGKVVKNDDTVTKTISLFEFDDDGEVSFTQVENISEIAFLSTFTAPFLPRLRSVKVDLPTVEIVEDYCGRDLYDLTDLPELVRYKFFPELLLQITRILLWLKRHKCAHMDIKPENICVDSTGKVTLIDWGLVGIVSRWSSPFHGTVQFADPVHVVNKMGPSYAYDVMSTGLTLYSFLACNDFKLPKKQDWLDVATHDDPQYALFQILNKFDDIRDKLVLYHGKHTGTLLHDILKSMVSVDTHTRPSALSIYTLPIFRDLWSKYPIHNDEFPERVNYTYFPHSVHVGIDEFVNRFINTEEFQQDPQILNVGLKIFCGFIECGGTVSAREIQKYIGSAQVVAAAIFGAYLPKSLAVPWTPEAVVAILEKVRWMVYPAFSCPDLDVYVRSEKFMSQWIRYMKCIEFIVLPEHYKSLCIKHFCRIPS